MLHLRALPVVVAISIGTIPLAPPEHVHETTDLDGHHAAVTHRHAETHRAYVRLEDHDRSSLENADSIVATLQFVSTFPSSGYVHTIPAPEVVTLLRAPVAPVRLGSWEFIELLIHGPPRAPTSLRAPPSPPFV